MDNKCGSCEHYQNEDNDEYNGKCVCTTARIVKRYRPYNSKICRAYQPKKEKLL